MLREMLASQISENRKSALTIAALRTRIAELEQLVDTDTLTPLPNRRRFVREVQRAVEQGRRYGHRAWVMFADLDSLKHINDTHGHLVGDAALIHVAGLLRDQVRAADIVARIGGDEFGLLLEEIGERSVREKADQLVAAVRGAPLECAGHVIPLSITIGIAPLKTDDDAEQLIDRADQAMYLERSQLRSAR